MAFTMRMKKSLTQGGLHGTRGPVMTRMHFEFIADVLKNSRPLTDPGEEPTVMWKILVMRFGQRLAETNPSFDVQRFRKACGL